MSAAECWDDPQTGPNAAWADVLASVEADVARTHELVRDASGGADGVIRLRERGDAPHLPAIDEMPAVPTDLLARMSELRARIGTVQHEIAQAMAETQLALASLGTPQATLRSVYTASDPVYIDRVL